MLNGIFWVLRTDTPWRGLPERYGSRRTVASQYRRWRLAGIWDEVLRALQEGAAHDGALDGSPTLIDGSNVRAH